MNEHTWMRSLRPLKPLFYPKALSKEIETMLAAEERLGCPGLVCWWQRVKQSRDVWAETKTEFIRAHVVPRRQPFDPSFWKTQWMECSDESVVRNKSH